MAIECRRASYTDVRAERTGKELSWNAIYTQLGLDSGFKTTLDDKIEFGCRNTFNTFQSLGFGIIKADADITPLITVEEHGCVYGEGYIQSAKAGYRQIIQRKRGIPSCVT